MLGVTAALLACGAGLGAVAATLAAVVAFSVTAGPLWGEIPVNLIAVAVTGAVLGGVLLPAACWLLMRRVPLGLAFAGTMLGTVTGGVLGWVLEWVLGDYSVSLLQEDPDLIQLPGLATGAGVGAVLGFLLATVALRLRFRAPREAGGRPVPRSAA
ncbi:MAG TPA: hypothetical protein VFS20_04645 [Longimicrobium sp.]|nr:hypothetical protein [Longimicrobium sp.]